jgi:hypothetical protein
MSNALEVAIVTYHTRHVQNLNLKFKFQTRIIGIRGIPVEGIPTIGLGLAPDFVSISAPAHKRINLA